MAKEKRPVSKELTEQNPALKKAVHILLYGSECSVRRLKEKLERAGFSHGQIEEAVLEVIDCGLLWEEDQVKRLAEYLGNVQCYGRHRILQTLYQKGYSKEVICEIDFSEIDFETACKKRLQRCYPREIAALKQGQGELLFQRCRTRYSPKEKLCAAAMRYGYSYSEAVDALESICEEDL